MASSLSARRARPATLTAVNYSGTQSDPQLIALWLGTFQSPHTQTAYAHDLHSCLQACGSLDPRTLSSLTVADLQAWVTQLRDQAYHPASINRKLAAVKSLLSFGYKTGYLPFNVGAALPTLKVENRLTERILTERDTLNLLHAPGLQPRDHLFVRYLYYLGVRVGEACGLRWRHLSELAGSTPVVAIPGKGGITRHVALPAGVCRQLQAWQQQTAWAGPDDPVFVTRTGKPLHPTHAHAIVRRAARRAGLQLPVSPHWLRHAHATHALNRGAPVHVVQGTLGHASLATTSRYVHMTPDHSSGQHLAGAQH